jgi:hypothetical protein
MIAKLATAQTLTPIPVKTQKPTRDLEIRSTAKRSLIA